VADQIKVPIVSTYDDKGAKKALDDAKKLDQAKPKVTVTADTKTAERDITGLMKKVDLLDKDAATILLTSNATKIAGDITDLIVDIDKLDANDVTIEAKATEINDLKADLDKIESKIKEVNQTEIRPEIDSSSMQKTREETESTRSSISSMANSVGNNASEMGAALGLGGPIGQSIGEFGEYMSEARLEGENFGTILSNFGKFAGPIAALSIGVQLVTSAIQKSQESAKLNAENIERMTEAIRKGGDVTENYAESLSEAEDSQVQFGKAGIESIGILGQIAGMAPGLTQSFGDVGESFGLFGKEAEKLTDVLHGSGIGIEHWSEIVTAKDPQEALRNLEKFLRGTTLGIGEQKDIFAAASQAQKDWAKGQENAGRAAEFFGDKAKQQAEHAKALNKAYADGVDPMETYNRLQEEGADQIDRVNAKLQEQADALNEQVDAATTAADAQRDENKALEDFADVLGDAKASTDDVVDSAIDLAKSHKDTAEAQAKATGQTITATQKLDAQNDALLDTAATANGPARQGILNYVGTVNQIPPEKLTEIQAAIDAGDLDTAKRLLAEASAPRTAAINADANTAAAERELDLLTKDRIVKISPVFGTTTRYDRGGRVGPDGAVAAERRPEFIRLPGGETGLLTEPAFVPPGTQVTSGAETERILRDHAAATSVTNVSINLPRGTRPEDAVRAADRYARRNGRTHAPRR
jgi:hypothetical protein